MEQNDFNNFIENRNYIQETFNALRDKNPKKFIRLWLESDLAIQENIAHGLHIVEDYNSGKIIFDKFSQYYGEKNISPELQKAYIDAFKNLGTRCPKLDNEATIWLIKNSQNNQQKELFFSFAWALREKATRYILPLVIKNEEIKEENQKILADILEEMKSIISRMPDTQEKKDVLYNFSQFAKLPQLRQPVKEFLSKEWQKVNIDSELYDAIADELIIVVEEKDKSLMTKLAAIVKARIEQNPNDGASSKLLRQLGNVGDQSFLPLIDQIIEKYPYPGFKMEAREAKEKINLREKENDNE